jgi:hypothetical protein
VGNKTYHDNEFDPRRMDLGKPLRDPVRVAIEVDITSVGSNGLLDWLKQYYGMKPGMPAPLFMAADAADPLDLLRSYNSHFESATRAVLTEAARSMVGNIKNTIRNTNPMDFFLAARLAEVADQDELWLCLGTPLKKWRLAPPSNTNERIAVREAFESLFRAVDHRVERTRLSGKSSVLGRRDFDPFEAACRAAMVELTAAPQPPYVCAHAPLFFLAVAYDIIFAQYDELTVKQRSEDRLEVMASLFTKHEDTSLDRFESALAGGSGPYDLDAVQKTWPNFLALAFNRPIRSVEDLPTIDAPIRGLSISEAGYYSKLSGPDRLQIREREYQDA